MSEPGEKPLTKPLFGVALAASAGGLVALSQILSSLPLNFAAAILVLQHVSPYHVSYLVDILSHRTLLKVKQAEDDDRLSAGTIYVAPPNWHLLVKPEGILKLTQTEPLHFVRPSADLLFESLANTYRAHAIAVVLTGTGVDGADGVKKLKVMGGIVIAQDEASSEFFGMPHAAIQTGNVDHILPLNEIAPFLENLVTVGKIK